MVGWYMELEINKGITCSACSQQSDKIRQAMEQEIARIKCLYKMLSAVASIAQSLALP
jgi:hypothetical protein